MHINLKVEEYKPPKEMVEVAEHRTKDILRKWSWNQDNTIGQLAISLYLQGMCDVINVSKLKS